MKNSYFISVIIPVYNSEKFIKNSIKSLLNQSLKKFEVIIIDDGSTDNTVNIIKSFNNPKIKIFFLKKNYGPATARNLGLKKAKGKYIFFLDSDDTIEKNTLKNLFFIAKKKNFDFVFCDHKWIENNINLKKNFFSYNYSKEINKKDLIKYLESRLFNPIHFGGVLRCKGKLIKKSILEKNKINFEKNLRYLEDEIFMWDVLPYLKKIKYLKKQHYIYQVNPHISTGVTEGISKGINLNKFILIKKHIYRSFKLLGLEKKKSKKLSEQAFVYFIINILISYCKSIIQKKVEIKFGKKVLKKLIREIFRYKNLFIIVKKYKVSKYESYLLHKFLLEKKTKHLIIACFKRAKEIISMRKKYHIN